MDSGDDSDVHEMNCKENKEQKQQYLMSVTSKGADFKPLFIGKLEII